MKQNEISEARAPTRPKSAAHRSFFGRKTTTPAPTANEDRPKSAVVHVRQRTPMLARKISNRLTGDTNPENLSKSIRKGSHLTVKTDVEALETSENPSESTAKAKHVPFRRSNTFSHKATKLDKNMPDFTKKTSLHKEIYSPRPKTATNFKIKLSAANSTQPPARIAAERPKTADPTDRRFTFTNCQFDNIRKIFRQHEDTPRQKMVERQLTKKEVVLQKQTVLNLQKHYNEMRNDHRRKKELCEQLEAKLRENEKKEAKPKSDESISNATLNVSEGEALANKIENVRKSMQQAERYVKTLYFMQTRLKSHKGLISASLASWERRAASARKEIEAYKVQKRNLQNEVFVAENNLRDMKDKREEQSTLFARELEFMELEQQEALRFSMTRQKADRQRDCMVRDMIRADTKVRKRLDKKQEREESLEVELTKTSLNLMQYANEYQRLVRQTGESDVVTLIDRFMSQAPNEMHLAQLKAETEARFASLEVQVKEAEHAESELKMSSVGHIHRNRRLRDNLEKDVYEKQQTLNDLASRYGQLSHSLRSIREGIADIAEVLTCSKKTSFQLPPITRKSSSASIKRAIDDCILKISELKLDRRTAQPHNIQQEEISKLLPTILYKINAQELHEKPESETTLDIDDTLSVNQDEDKDDTDAKLIQKMVEKEKVKQQLREQDRATAAGHGQGYHENIELLENHAESPRAQTNPTNRGDLSKFLDQNAPINNFRSIKAWMSYQMHERILELKAGPVTPEDLKKRQAAVLKRVDRTKRAILKQEANDQNYDISVEQIALQTRALLREHYVSQRLQHRAMEHFYREQTQKERVLPSLAQREELPEVPLNPSTPKSPASPKKKDNCSPRRRSLMIGNC